MKFGKGAVIAVIVIICVLAAALFFQRSGNTDSAHNTTDQSDTITGDSTTSDGDADAQTPEANPAQDTSPSPATSTEDTAEDTAANAHEETTPPAEDAVSPSAPDPSQTTTPDTSSSSQEDVLTCSLTINCATILDNLDKLATGKEPLVPSDGSLLSLTDVVFEEGDSVFDILQRELKNQNMHMEFSISPMYGSAYIEGLCNLYEFDCGELSGWEFSVNGQFESCSCSEYFPSSGDIIAWVYTCDNGRDVGNDF